VCSFIVYLEANLSSILAFVIQLKMFSADFDSQVCMYRFILRPAEQSDRTADAVGGEQPQLLLSALPCSSRRLGTIPKPASTSGNFLPASHSNRARKWPSLQPDWTS
jgi:hypothetical protein